MIREKRDCACVAVDSIVELGLVSELRDCTHRELMCGNGRSLTGLCVVRTEDSAIIQVSPSF